MSSNNHDTGSAPDTPCEHCGTFTLGGNIPIQGTWRDITYTPVRDNIWSVSEGIYQSIFLKDKQGVVAFDTLTTPGAARAYAAAVGRVYPNNPIHTIVYYHDHLDHTGYAADMAPEACIIAHDLCDQVIRARGADGQWPATEVFGALFRYGEYCAMNLSRYMQHFLTGGWGIEDTPEPGLVLADTVA